MGRYYAVATRPRRPNILARLPASVIYRSPAVYGLAMRALYGRHYATRDAAVAAHVPDGASVLELCCGPARLYLRHLRGRVGSYVAIDAGERFVERLRRRGVDARLADVAAVQLPVADVVLMQASLYQFLPRAEPVLRRMVAAARDRVVVCEPVRNLADSRSAVVRRLAARGAATGAGAQPRRFDEPTLRALVDAAGCAVLASQPVAGGRERLYVLAGSAR